MSFRQPFALCSLVLLLSLLAACAAFSPIVITPITALSDIAAPLPNDGRPECMLLQRSGLAPSDTLQGLIVLIVTGTASSAYETTAAAQYYADRGATVEFFCTAALPAHNVLSEGHGFYPMYTIDPVAVCKTAVSQLMPAESYDVVIVPGGYAAVLPLRSGSHPFQSQFLSAFLSLTSASPSNRTRALVAVRGAEDVLLSQPLLMGTVQMNGWAAALPSSLSLSFLSAIRHCYGVPPALQLLMPMCQKMLEDPALVIGNVSAPYVVFQPARNASSSLLNAPNASFPLTVALASDEDFLLDVLAAVTIAVFGKPLLDVLPLNCSDRKASTNLTVPAVFTRVNPSDAGALQQLLQFTNVDSIIANFSLAAACANKQGNNFCSNAPVSLVVANGAHDQSVISAVQALSAANTELRVFCPDTDEHRGVAYLMPEPSTAPTYAISCSTFLNETDLVKESVIVIVTGPLATHGFVARSADVLSVLQFTGAYSLFGTALVLLLGLKSHEDIVDVPFSPYTNDDLRIAGYNVSATGAAVNTSGGGTTSGSSVANQYWYRAPSLKHAKVLAGYTSGANVTVGFAAFVQQTIALIVWDSADTTHTNDPDVIGIWLGVGLLAVVAVFAVKKIKTAQKRTYSPVATNGPGRAAESGLDPPSAVLERESSIPSIY